MPPKSASFRRSLVVALAFFLFACGNSRRAGTDQPLPVRDSGTPDTRTGAGPDADDMPAPFDAGRPDVSSVGPLEIFITSTAYTGDLDGVAGADATCALHAQAAGKTGHFVAWVSVRGSSAIDRITGDGPWHSGGTTIFNNRSNLQTGPLSGIYYDENGEFTDHSRVWTGTLRNGQAGEDTCGGWNSVDGSTRGQVGLIGSDTETWSEYTTSSCGSSTEYPIYCFEVR